MQKSNSNVNKQLKKIEAEVSRIRHYYQKSLSYKINDPDAALWMARKAAEAICRQLFKQNISPDPGNIPLHDLIGKLKHVNILPERILVPLYAIQKYGNYGAHDHDDAYDKINQDYVEACLSSLSTVISWYFDEYLTQKWEKAAQYTSVRQEIGFQTPSPGRRKLSLLKIVILLTTSSILLIITSTILSSLIVQRTSLKDYSELEPDTPNSVHREAGTAKADKDIQISDSSASLKLIDAELAKLWRIGDYQGAYEKAKHLQEQGIADLSIPAYWRVMSFQNIHWHDNIITEDKAKLKEILLEYEKGMKLAPEGDRADDLLYQFARFNMLQGKLVESRETLSQIQSRFPGSNWKQGTAYYLGVLFLEAGDKEEANKQLVLLKSYDLSGRMYMFEKNRFISVREAIAQLTKLIESHYSD